MEYVLQWCESAFGHGNPLVRAAVLQDSTVRSHFCLRSSVTPVGTLSPQAPCGVLESQRVEWYGLFLPLPSSPLVRREGVTSGKEGGGSPRYPPSCSPALWLRLRAPDQSACGHCSEDVPLPPSPKNTEVLRITKALR